MQVIVQDDRDYLIVNGTDIVYVGEYEGIILNGFNRRSEGWRYEYEKGILKRVFVCKDKKDIYKQKEIAGDWMNIMRMVQKYILVVV